MPDISVVLLHIEILLLVPVVGYPSTTAGAPIKNSQGPRVKIRVNPGSEA